MNVGDLIKFSPLLALIISEIVLIVTILTTSVQFNNTHQIGLIALIGVIVIQVIARELGFILTGILLVLGVFQVLSFTPTLYFFGVGSLEIDIFCFVLLIIFIIIH